jgi:hypothetical protein
MAAAFHPHHPEYGLSKTGPARFRNGLGDYDRRKAIAGRWQSWKRWKLGGRQLTEINIPTDLAPWRLAVVLSVMQESIAYRSAPAHDPGAPF